MNQCKNIAESEIHAYTVVLLVHSSVALRNICITLHVGPTFVTWYHFIARQLICTCIAMQETFLQDL